MERRKFRQSESENLSKTLTNSQISEKTVESSTRRMTNIEYPNRGNVSQGGHLTTHFESPKTEYTYAKSTSYNSNYDEHCDKPNMSRPALRGDSWSYVVDASPSKYSTMSTNSSTSSYYLRSSSNNNNNNNNNNNTTTKTNILESLAPMDTQVKESGQVKQQEIGQVFSTKDTNKGFMVNKGNSPMVSSSMLLGRRKQGLVADGDGGGGGGCHGGSSQYPRTNEIKRGNRFAYLITTIFSTIWSIVRYPISKLSSSSSSSPPSSYSSSQSQSNRMSSADAYDTTRRRRSMMMMGGGGGGGSSGGGGGGASNESKSLLYSIAGTIGGVMYVFKNALWYVCGLSNKATTSIDDAVLSRTRRIIGPTSQQQQQQQQQHGCYCCYIPLFLILSLLCIGGAYVYLCGSTNQEQVFKVGGQYWGQLKDYSKPMLTTGAMGVAYLYEGKDKLASSLSSSFTSLSSSLSSSLSYLLSLLSPTPSSPPSSSTPQSASSSSSSPPSSSSSSSSSSPSLDLSTLARKKDLNDLKMYVDEFINSKWKNQVENECKSLTDGLNVKLESSTKNVDSVVSNMLNDRMQQLNDDLLAIINKKFNQIDEGDKEHSTLMQSLKSDIENWKVDYARKFNDLVTLANSRKSDDEDDDDAEIKKAKDVETMKTIELKINEIILGLKHGLVNDINKYVDDKMAASEKEVVGMGDGVGMGGGLSEEEIERVVRMKMDDYFNEVLNVEKKSNNQDGGRFNDQLLLWLSNNEYVNKNDVDEKLTIVSNEMSTRFQRLIDDKIQNAIRENINKWKSELPLSSSSSSLSGAYISKEEVLKVIDDTLLKYDADKTGMADYALESGGGSVVGTRCSKTYRKGMAQVSILGIPLWYATNSPRTVIQPGTLPGQCWPFSGSVGYLVVQLATRIHVTMVSIEHVSRFITTFGGIESAPKDFSILGLTDPQDVDGVILGNFTYDQNGGPLQYFHIPSFFHMNAGRTFSQNEPPPRGSIKSNLSLRPKPPTSHLAEYHNSSYLYIELRVYSNHGNDKYTCLYRLRVHGKPALS